MTAIRICALAELGQDEAIRVDVDDISIAIVKDSSGTVHAIGDTCTHGDISLSEGFVEGETLECWAHGVEVLSRDRQAHLPSGLRAGSRLPRDDRRRRRLRGSERNIAV